MYAVIENIYEYYYSSTDHYTSFLNCSEIMIPKGVYPRLKGMNNSSPRDSYCLFGPCMACAYNDDNYFYYTPVCVGIVNGKDYPNIDVWYVCAISFVTDDRYDYLEPVEKEYVTDSSFAGNKILFNPSTELYMPSSSLRNVGAFRLYTDDANYAIPGYDWVCTPQSAKLPYSSNPTLSITGVSGTTPALKSMKIYATSWEGALIYNTTQPNVSITFSDHGYNISSSATGFAYIIFCDEEDGQGNEFMELSVPYNFV